MDFDFLLKQASVEHFEFSVKASDRIFTGGSKGQCFYFGVEHFGIVLDGF